MNYNEKKNYYEVLEVSPNSTLQDIHSAYIRSKNAYNGDSAALYSLLTPDECAKILEQIEEAYCILGVPEKRREYDKAKGFNQNFTPEGFQEKMNETPDYKPQASLETLLSETSVNHQEIALENKMREEFTYQQEQSVKDDTTVSKVQAFKKFGLNYDEDPQFEQEIENCTEFSGEFLKKIREYKQVTIERMADMTRVSKTYIRNIEEDEFAKLPAEVYTRGFVYQYAKCLKLNPDLIATSYLQHLKNLKNDSVNDIS